MVNGLLIDTAVSKFVLTLSFHTYFLQNVGVCVSQTIATGKQISNHAHSQSLYVYNLVLTANCHFTVDSLSGLPFELGCS